jgi:hypothetical protein
MLLSILSLVETSHVNGRRDTIQGTTAISNEWVLVIVDMHDPQTHCGAVLDRGAFVGYILLFVECHYLIYARWVVELQPERVLCRDCSLDRHYHIQVEKLAANHHRRANGGGVGVRVAKALFKHLKGMGLNVLPKLL